MLFNSLQYIIFFPLVVTIYFLLPKVKHLRLMLLAASWFFYMAWKPEYIILLLTSTSIDYFVALRLSKVDEKRKRNLYLMLSVGVNLLILFGFKYFTFFDKNIHRFFGQFNLFDKFITDNIILPVGISFYTFQTMSYTIDVYKKKILPERNFVKFALFVSFFPQLVAGPIERASHLLKQFDKKHTFSYRRVTSGLKLIFWGFFQKIVIADNMSRFVEAVYSNPTNYAGLDIILVTFFFSVQIYGDFSGYTDIARGSARILGINIRRNFNLPYFAKSFADFWRRWHISLSTWFRDYVYIPLGGNRSGNRYRFAFNIFATFILSGFWHGASWTFIIWGFLHGFFYTVERYFKKFKKDRNNKTGRINRILKIIFVFVAVNFAWIFFRSKSVMIALTLIKNTFNFSQLKISFDHTAMLINLLLSTLLFVVHLIERKKNIVAYVSEKPVMVRWSIYYIMIIILLIFGNFGIKEFIYFQF